MYASWHGEIFAGKYYAVHKHPWVSRIVGIHPLGELQREFLRGLHDYSHGKVHHSRGVYVYFAIPSGIYEFFRPVSWRRDERFFARVTDEGQIQHITKQEIVECLNGVISE